MRLMKNWKLHAALAIGCLALALSIYTAVRGPSGAPAGGAHACIDQEARAGANELRRALADRDAVIARLARSPVPVPGVPAAGAAAGGTAPPSTPAEQGPRRYTHFEIPNPAVTVTQKDDGTYDIRTADPALSGTVVEITAVTSSGTEDRMLIRIP